MHPLLIVVHNARVLIYRNFGPGIRHSRFKRIDAFVSSSRYFFLQGGSHWVVFWVEIRWVRLPNVGKQLLQAAIVKLTECTSPQSCRNVHSVRPKCSVVHGFSTLRRTRDWYRHPGPDHHQAGKRLRLTVFAALVCCLPFMRSYWRLFPAVSLSFVDHFYFRLIMQGTFWMLSVMFTIVGRALQRQSTFPAAL